MVELPHLLSSVNKDFQLPASALAQCQYWLGQVDLNKDYHSQILPIGNFFSVLAEHIKDPDWVWQQGSQRMPSDFGVFGPAIALAETLEESLQMLIDFSSAAFPVHVHRSEDSYYCYLHVRFPNNLLPSLWLHINYVVAGFCRFLQTYYDIHRELVAVAIPLSSRALIAKHLLAMKPYYRANELTFRLRKEYCDAVNLRPDVHTKADLLSLCQLKLLSLKASHSFSDKVNKRLQRGLPDCPSMKQVADELCISPRTLRKKLTNENTCFSALAVEVKMRRGCYLLVHTRDNIEQVAWQTGYLDAGNFRKVFKQTYAMTPTEFRRIKASGGKV